MDYPMILSPDQLMKFMHGASMNNQYGIQLYMSLDKEKAQKLLPPPLKVAGTGMGFVYIVNIREPTFAPAYMEGGVGIMAEYNGIVGLHLLGLMLSGHGALMGMCSGRELSGLPKKLCDRIRVERNGDNGHCFIERGGTRLIDVELKMGEYNAPPLMAQYAAREKSSRENPVDEDGSCLLFKYKMGGAGFAGMEMVNYDSPTRFFSWDPAFAKVTLASTEDDPWASLPVTGVLGAGWMVSDNWVESQKTLHTYPDSEAGMIMAYLFSGRFDKCTLNLNHQIYE